LPAVADRVVGVGPIELVVRRAGVVGVGPGEALRADELVAIVVAPDVEVLSRATRTWQAAPVL
ncbi:MAG: hypothetical protein DRN81_06930, partial [Thermoproteota archaeon]